MYLLKTDRPTSKLFDLQKQKKIPIDLTNFHQNMIMVQYTITVNKMTHTVPCHTIWSHNPLPHKGY